jgi:hypothetical protein
MYLHLGIFIIRFHKSSISMSNSVLCWCTLLLLICCSISAYKLCMVVLFHSTSISFLTIFSSYFSMKWHWFLVKASMTLKFCSIYYNRLLFTTTVLLIKPVWTLLPPLCLDTFYRPQLYEDSFHLSNHIFSHVHRVSIPISLAPQCL